MAAAVSVSTLDKVCTDFLRFCSLFALLFLARFLFLGFFFRVLMNFGTGRYSVPVRSLLIKLI